MNSLKGPLSAVIGLALLCAGLLHAGLDHVGAQPANPLEICPPNQVLLSPASGTQAGIVTCRKMVTNDLPGGPAPSNSLYMSGGAAGSGRWLQPLPQSLLVFSGLGAPQFLQGPNSLLATDFAGNPYLGQTMPPGLTFQSPLFNNLLVGSGGTGTTTCDDKSGNHLNWNGRGIFCGNTVNPTGQSVSYKTKTGTYALVSGDLAGLINATSGTWTLTLLAPSTAGAGWYFYFENTGTGTITLSPASGNIDGLSSYKSYSGEARLITTDGTNYFSVVLNPYSISLTSTTTITSPPGYQGAMGIIWGGGGSGGSGGAASTGDGGGGGAAVPFVFTAAQFTAAGSTIVCTVGAGGNGVAAGSNAGNTGNNSTLGTLVTAYGGGGGQGGGGFSGGGGGALSAGSGSTGIGGAPNSTSLIANLADNEGFGGGDGNNGSSAGGNAAWGGGGGGANAAVAGGKSLYGGGGGGGTSAAAGGAGGTSVFGGNGSAGVVSGTSAAGTQPGGGSGGGGNGNGATGNGGAGQCNITGII